MEIDKVSSGQLVAFNALDAERDIVFHTLHGLTEGAHGLSEGEPVNLLAYRGYISSLTSLHMYGFFDRF